MLAVDIGGTKLAAALIGEDGSVDHRRSVATAGDDGDAVFGALAGLIAEVMIGVATEVAAVGVGTGGPMTPAGEAVSPLNIPQWRDFPLRRRLGELIGLPVFVDNDAKALALGEGWWGAAAEVDDFLAMVVSTGVGGGLVVDGRLLDGARYNAGHVGHMIAVADGQPCTCGARGCLEAEISGSSIERTTGRPAAEADYAVRIRAGTLLGRVAGSVANLLDLELAVVAGSVALGFGDPFFAAAQAEIDRVCRIGFSRGFRIVPAGLGDRGPLVGAGAVAWRGLGFGRFA